MRIIKGSCFILITLIVPLAKAKSLNEMVAEFLDDDVQTRNRPIPTHCGRNRYESSQNAIHRRTATMEASPSRKKRIVGGGPSRLAEWPWLVSMMISINGSRPEHLCGGTLIHPQWVLTAGHCFEDVWAPFLTLDPTFWMTRLGEHNLFRDEERHQDIPPVKIILHSQRNAPTTDNLDIALVKLAYPAKLGNDVNVVCLPDQEDDRHWPPGSLCTIAGWGHTQENGNVSEIIRHVQVPILPNALCQRMYGAVTDLTISPDMLCAGYKKGGSDACQYDSGGPMVCHDVREDEYLQMAIVSTGYGCARAKYPGIYTRVSKFIDWIEQTVSANTD